MDMSAYTDRAERTMHQAAITRAMEPVASRVIVGAFLSTCEACGGNADPDEPAHISGGRRNGYAPGSATADSNGCGAVFAEVISPYKRPAGGAQ